MRLHRSNQKSAFRHIVITFILVFSGSCTLVASGMATAEEASSSSVAPDFSLPSIVGHKSLSDYRGQFLYVDFWASWCGPCRQSFPWMNEMLAKYDADGLKIIAINLDENHSDADQFLKYVQADVDIAFDKEGLIAEAFNVRGMPSSYLINPDGEIVFSHIGFRERDAVLLETEIVKVIGGGE